MNDEKSDFFIRYSDDILVIEDSEEKTDNRDTESAFQEKLTLPA